MNYAISSFETAKARAGEYILDNIFQWHLWVEEYPYPLTTKNALINIFVMNLFFFNFLQFIKRLNAEHFLQTEILKILFQSCQHSKISVIHIVPRISRFADCCSCCLILLIQLGFTVQSLWSIAFITFQMIVICCIERELSPIFHLPERNEKNWE